MLSGDKSLGLSAFSIVRFAMASSALKKRQRPEAGLEAAFDMQKSELMVPEMEVERLADNAVKKELLEVHLEVEKLRAENQELTIKLQKLTEQVKADKRSEVNQCFPELQAELEGLQKEYQSIRSEFEQNRDINTKQTEQMKTMEMSLIAMTEQVDKLCAEMQNADMRAQGLATAVQVAAGQSGTAQAQVAYGSALNYLPAQTTQVGQSGAAQAQVAYGSAFNNLPAQTTQANLGQHKLRLQSHISKQLKLGLALMVCLTHTPIPWRAIKMCKLVDMLATQLQVMIRMPSPTIQSIVATLQVMIRMASPTILATQQVMIRMPCTCILLPMLQLRWASQQLMLPTWTAMLDFLPVPGRLNQWATPLSTSCLHQMLLPSLQSALHYWRCEKT